MGPAAESMPDLTGCVVDERYQLLTMLGAGAFGVVYHAIDVDPLSDPDRMDVAVKVISKSARSPRELEMVRQEVALQREVSNHQNVVQIYDAFEDDEYFFIILDLCRGGNLYEQACINEVYMGKDELLRGAFLSLISAVQACHQSRVYHRDLKPENIMTNEDGSEVYLADFGLATDKNVVNDRRVGTEGYMSPECLGSLGSSMPYCTRPSDVWALGVILINMITRRQPWGRAEPEDECFARFLTEPGMLKMTLPISDSAHTILQRIFVLNPIRRITLTDLRRAILEVDTFFADHDELKEDERCGGQQSDKAAVGSIDHLEKDISDCEPEDGLWNYPRAVKKARLSEEWDDEVVYLIARFPIREADDDDDDDSSGSSTRTSSRDAYAKSESFPVVRDVPGVVEEDCDVVVYQRPKRKRADFSEP
ncbi:kinase-like protein [Lentinus tigrinus ALCF2SS1-7]|uniref:kinase-like protein n=1 Tax=Lentinus tigrinus ALCF2SS1-7 TaxID=1328758 RepID=UPI0011661E7C|nr:kinase-like protein [Lentinus tigrinus ALCF2SS1-7]